MIKSNIEKLREPVWFTPFPDTDENPDEIEVQLVPAATAEVANSLFRGDDTFCREAFINFKGYWEDKGKTKPVANTLEHRLELMKWDAFRNAVRVQMGVYNEAIVRGEDLGG